MSGAPAAPSITLYTARDFTHAGKEPDPMSIDPREVPNVIRRKAEDNYDKAGAVCELVTAITFGLRTADTPTRPAQAYHGHGRTRRNMTRQS